MSNADQPHLRFLLSAELNEKTRSTLEMIEHSKNPSMHHHELTAVVTDLIKEGMHYYFVKPQELANVGFIGLKSSKLGIEGFLKMSTPMVKKTFSAMDDGQLLTICAFIGGLMK